MVVFVHTSIRYMANVRVLCCRGGVGRVGTHQTNTSDILIDISRPMSLHLFDSATSSVSSGEKRHEKIVSGSSGITRRSYESCEHSITFADKRSRDATVLPILGLPFCSN